MPDIVWNYIRVRGRLTVFAKGLSMSGQEKGLRCRVYVYSSPKHYAHKLTQQKHKFGGFGFRGMRHRDSRPTSTCPQ